MTLRQYLKDHRLICDGAMGTYYASKENQQNAVSEYAVLTNPDSIRRIHREYLQAGANLIKTNTFMANSVSLSLSKEELVKLRKDAVVLCRDAIKEEAVNAYVAGDIGPIPETSLASEEDILQEYLEWIDGFLANKVDAILFETFSSLRYINELVQYIREKDSDVFIMVSMCFNKNGYTASGLSIAKFFEEMERLPQADAAGLNCGIGSGHMASLLEQVRLLKHQYVIAAPNAGYPEQIQNRLVFMDNTEFFAENIKRLFTAGTAIIGSCCGTSPEYTKRIAKLGNEYKAVKIEEFPKKAYSVNLEVTEPVQPQKNPMLEKLEAGKKVIAVELDPPYDGNDDKIINCGKILAGLDVDMITLADSPRGRSRIDSILMSLKLMRVCQMNVMPHICCRDKNMIAMRSGLLGAHVNDIRNLLIVTGDPVPQEGRGNTSNVFDYNSIRLMEFVKQMNEEHFTSDPFVYGGALNYAGTNIDNIVERMEKKLAAGASYFLTQPVYSDQDIERIHELRERTGAKILSGIMPFVSYTNANFVAHEFAGIHVPEEIVSRYSKDMSKEEAEITGATLGRELMTKLAPYSDGYYFMLPFNRVSMLEKILTQD